MENGWSSNVCTINICSENCILIELICLAMLKNTIGTNYDVSFIGSFCLVEQVRLRAFIIIVCGESLYFIKSPCQKHNILLM